jgi:hypothetical protein
MASKLLAGSLMLLPAFALDTYYGYTGLIMDSCVGRGRDESLVESAGKTGKRWGILAAGLGVGGMATLGLFHVMLGGIELSPQICPRVIIE